MFFVSENNIVFACSICFFVCQLYFNVVNSFFSLSFYIFILINSVNFARQLMYYKECFVSGNMHDEFVRK